MFDVDGLRDAMHPLHLIQDFFRRIRGSPQSLKTHPRYHAILDSGDNTLVAVGTSLAAVLATSESLLDTWSLSWIADPRIAELSKIEPRTLPEWSWSARERGFIPTNPALVTDALRDRAELAAKKVAAFSLLIRRINTRRAKLTSGYFFQERIYTAKEREARALKEARNNPEQVYAPYVRQYAEISDIAPEVAADEILLRAELDHEYLTKTEEIRLLLSQKIRRAKTPEDVGVVIEEIKSMV